MYNSRKRAKIESTAASRAVANEMLQQQTMPLSAIPIDPSLGLIAGLREHIVGLELINQCLYNELQHANGQIMNLTFVNGNLQEQKVRDNKELAACKQELENKKTKIGMLQKIIESKTDQHIMSSIVLLRGVNNETIKLPEEVKEHITSQPGIYPALKSLLENSKKEHFLKKVVTTTTTVSSTNSDLWDLDTNLDFSGLFSDIDEQDAPVASEKSQRKRARPE